MILGFRSSRHVKGNRYRRTKVRSAVAARERFNYRRPHAFLRSRGGYLREIAPSRQEMGRATAEHPVLSLQGAGSIKYLYFSGCKLLGSSFIHSRTVPYEGTWMAPIASKSPCLRVLCGRPYRRCYAALWHWHIRERMPSAALSRQPLSTDAHTPCVTHARCNALILLRRTTSALNFQCLPGRVVFHCWSARTCPRELARYQCSRRGLGELEC